MSNKDRDLIKLIDSTIIELHLSPSNPMNSFPHQEQYALNLIQSLDKKFKKANKEERLEIHRQMTYIYQPYWKLLKFWMDAYKDSKNKNFYNEYTNKTRNFSLIIDGYIHSLEDKIDNDSENKIVYAECLINIYRIKLEVATYVWQYPSSEYMSIFSGVIKNIEELKEKIMIVQDENNYPGTLEATLVKKDSRYYLRHNKKYMWVIVGLKIKNRDANTVSIGMQKLDINVNNNWLEANKSNTTAGLIEHDGGSLNIHPHGILGIDEEARIEGYDSVKIKVAYELRIKEYESEFQTKVPIKVRGTVQSLDGRIASFSGEIDG